MSATDLSAHDALVRLGASSAEAIAQVLEMFAPGAVERGDVTVIGAGQSPFNGVVTGSVAASVSYVDGVTGANIFVLTAAGVRNLAMAMGMPAPEEGPDAELSELELSAVGEASNQMMAAAASAIGVVLGQEIEISVPDIRVLDEPQAAGDIYGSSPHATSTTFLIGGESCRLIQLVPRAFVVRMARALDELEGERLDDEAATGDPSERDGAAASVALTEALTSIKVRVWAELGRSKLGLGRALGLPLGSVVELDRDANAPVDLYVNGLRFAQGHLIVTDDGEWAFQCDAVGGRAAVDTGRAAAALAFAPEIPAAIADECVEELLAEETAADTAPVQDLSAAETAADTPQAVTAAETPAAPSTPNEEGAVT
jgi:flagellar motor switch protein FliN/FliY